MHPKSLAPMVLVLLLALVGIGCSDDEGMTRGSSPLPAPDSPDHETFSSLPEPPRSDPLSAREEGRGVVEQAYKAVGTTPVEVLGFYDRNLDGWSRDGGIEQVGDDRYRAAWTRGELRLVVEAGAGAADSPASEGRPDTVEYRLILRRAGG